VGSNPVLPPPGTLKQQNLHQPSAFPPITFLPPPMQGPRGNLPFPLRLAALLLLGRAFDGATFATTVDPVDSPGLLHPFNSFQSHGAVTPALSVTTSAPGSVLNVSMAGLGTVMEGAPAAFYVSGRWHVSTTEGGCGTKLASECKGSSSLLYRC